MRKSLNHIEVKNNYIGEKYEGASSFSATEICAITFPELEHKYLFCFTNKAYETII